MCSRCKDPVDEQLYHHTFIWLKCGCNRPRRVYCNPDKPFSDCGACGQPRTRTSDPRLHRSTKRPIVLHERTLPDGRVQSWAPFSADTPPPKGARVREITSVRELERMAAAGEVHDLLKYDESKLDEGVRAVEAEDADPEISEETYFREEMQMRQELGLSADESKIRESIADTLNPAPVPTIDS